LTPPLLPQEDLTKKKVASGKKVSTADADSADSSGMLLLLSLFAAFVALYVKFFYFDVEAGV
jgi:hypothetical protein